MQKLIWRDMIRELMAHGVTLQKMADRTGLAKSTMGDLATGRSLEPCGQAAVELFFMHNGVKAALARKRAKLT